MPTPFTTRFDIHTSYARRINKTMTVEGFLRVFNVFNQQPEIDVDEDYTFDDVNPCVGCSAEDLEHVKAAYTDTTISKNPNFGNVNLRQAPLSVQFGARLLF